MRPSIPALIERTDWFRRSPVALGGPGPHKEWQHFLVHTDEVHLLVNFNLIDDVWGDAGEVARLICMANDGRWEGDVERFDPADISAPAGGIACRFGENTMAFRDGAYHLHVALRDGSIRADLVLTPVTTPALANNQPLTLDKHLSWLFVPRLSASGTLTIGGRKHRVCDAPAYHDHNWGPFVWGDDFAWEWGSALPASADSPWSMVYMRMADRGRREARSQGLYLWRGEEPRAIFRDAQLSVTPEGIHEVEAPLTIPRIMRLLQPGRANDVPRRLRVVARSGADHVEMVFDCGDVARIVMPDETDLLGVTVLNEVSGAVALRGTVRGEAVAMDGPGVFEFIRG